MGKRDIMVFAPHPDDEAIGCAGQILHTLKSGGDVKIIVVANGESSVDGTERFYGHPPEKKDFIDIGLVRQKESQAAMEFLGLTADDVIFLGYPNDGLTEMLTSPQINEGNPYTSEFTGFDRVSYKNSYNMGAPFCRSSFESDIRNLFLANNPGCVYVSHPMDNHLDHRACGRFIYETLRRLENGVRFRFYFVARAKVPSPKRRLIYRFTGQLKENYLNADTRKLKKECIEKYESQAYLFHELDFHYEVERFWKLEQGIRAKIAKKIVPSLKF